MIFPIEDRAPLLEVFPSKVRCTRYLLHPFICKMVRPIVVLLLLVALVSASYSRFGSNKDTKPAESHPSINDQIMQGSHIRYYGRFRDGSDDVLNRYFNRL
ncbi:hypothetical protein L3Y34_008659 [Caenorhabditis briggsae]|uniref:Uncharacterized protein n=1 Tax=Caenorhabditis briggsae TaxID=6238 RepID=A0AAE9A0F1_CAEBR|nr:hypothetical protein L3Y34_008659 [Caenorhabditis briggsae]